jgi:hypothetical protein
MTENVIRVGMRADDVADRLVRASANRGEQSAAFPHTAAGIDDRHGIVADHETDIGDAAPVGTRHERERSWVHEHPGCHLGHGERFCSLFRMGSEAEAAKHHAAGEQHSRSGRNGSFDHRGISELTHGLEYREMLQ